VLSFKGYLIGGEVGFFDCLFKGFSGGYNAENASAVGNEFAVFI